MKAVAVETMASVKTVSAMAPMIALKTAATLDNAMVTPTGVSPGALSGAAGACRAAERQSQHQENYYLCPIASHDSLFAGTDDYRCCFLPASGFQAQGSQCPAVCEPGDWQGGSLGEIPNQTRGSIATTTLPCRPGATSHATIRTVTGPRGKILGSNGIEAKRPSSDTVKRP
jgi:hypothetical protein